MPLVVYLRGGGDLASGVAMRLHRAGLQVLIAELAQPLVVRRPVSFADAVYHGTALVEGVSARLVEGLEQAFTVMRQGEIAVLVDPEAKTLHRMGESLPGGVPFVLVDARMLKRSDNSGLPKASLVVGLGPGFVACENCHVVIETNRGHRLGRALWQGAPEPDTGIPDRVIDRAAERVLRAPADGELREFAEICDHLEPGQIVAEVAGIPVRSPFRGVLRGLIYPGLRVWKGLKIGDVDPRDDPRNCTLVSDKSLAIGGGVLEAILSRPELRPYLWS